MTFSKLYRQSETDLKNELMQNIIINCSIFSDTYDKLSNFFQSPSPVTETTYKFFLVIALNSLYWNYEKACQIN